MDAISKTDEKISPDYKSAYSHEKQARKEAERLLEVKSREIFQVKKELEEQFISSKRHAVEFQLLHEITNFTQNHTNDQATFEFFIQIICIECNWPIGHVYLISDDNKNQLNSANIWFIEDEESCSEFYSSTKTKTFKLGEGLPGQVLETAKSIWLENIKLDTAFLRAETLENYNIASAFAVPILAYDKVIAVVEFFASADQSIEPELLKVIDIAALHLGSTLERCKSEKQLKENYKELQQTINKLNQTQAQLVQSEKMASVGQLAAGVAHEINNPIGFVMSNTQTLHDYINIFKTLFKHYDNLQNDIIAANEQNFTEQLSVIDKLKDTEDIEFIIEDVDQLLSDSLDGMDRVKEIVRSLKEYSHVDQSEQQEADINECLETTLKIVNNELKYKAKITTDFKTIPKLSCHAGKLNQVFTNLLVNAGHAIEGQGEITVATENVNDHIVIHISDTGKGIAEEHIAELFTPFFTTKPVGEGTGLGLSISYGIVQEHGGNIEVESELGVGTTFSIYLPLNKLQEAV